MTERKKEEAKQEERQNGAAIISDVGLAGGGFVVSENLHYPAKKRAEEGLRHRLRQGKSDVKPAKRMLRANLSVGSHVFLKGLRNRSRLKAELDAAICASIERKIIWLGENASNLVHRRLAGMPDDLVGLCKLRDCLFCFWQSSINRQNP